MRHSALGDTATRGSVVGGKHHEGVSVSTRCGHVGPEQSHAAKQLSRHITTGCHGPVPDGACGQTIPQLPSCGFLDWCQVSREWSAVEWKGGEGREGEGRGGE